MNLNSLGNDVIHQIFYFNPEINLVCTSKKISSAFYKNGKFERKIFENAMKNSFQLPIPKKFGKEDFIKIRNQMEEWNKAIATEYSFKKIPSLYLNKTFEEVVRDLVKEQCFTKNFMEMLGKVDSLKFSELPCKSINCQEIKDRNNSNSPPITIEHLANINDPIYLSIDPYGRPMMVIQYIKKKKENTKKKKTRSALVLISNQTHILNGKELHVQFLGKDKSLGKKFVGHRIIKDTNFRTNTENLELIQNLITNKLEDLQLIEVKK